MLTSSARRDVKFGGAPYALDRGGRVPGHVRWPIHSGGNARMDRADAARFRGDARALVESPVRAKSRVLVEHARFSSVAMSTSQLGRGCGASVW